MKRFKPLMLISLSLLFATIMISGCDKDDEPDKDSELVSFTGLVAGKDSLAVGESTTITAVYEGKGVTFAWDASSGNLVGSGAQVEYVVAFCDIGVNTITCKATAENTSITKNINIKVYVQ